MTDPPPAPAHAHDALARLAAAALAHPALRPTEKQRAGKALVILFQQIRNCVDKIAPDGRPPPSAADLADVRAELAPLLDRVEDHLEALVLYQPRQP